jgi:hypothetical protein
MFAYIKNNSIFCICPISIKKLDGVEIKKREIKNEDDSISIEEYEEKTLIDNIDLLDTIEIEYDEMKISNPIYD